MSVTLTELFIHDAANQSDYLVLDLVGEVESFGVPTSRVRYAGGRQVHLNLPGSTQDLVCTVQYLTAVQLDDLRARVEAKQRVMVREPRGRIVWGRIVGFSAPEIIQPERTGSFDITVEQSGAQTAEV